MLAYIHHPQFELHEMGVGHPECPERLQSIEALLAVSRVNSRLQRYLARPATDELLLLAHTQAHLDRVEHAADRIVDEGVAYAMLDLDTMMNRHTFEAARLAAGAGVLAVDLVISGQHERAFCAVRPPGHHAEHARAMGFCFYSNIAVAAMHALDHHGLQRVAIVDFDVHHGNGTENVIAGDERVLMLSTFQSPFYPYSGEQPSGPNMLNIPLAEGSGGATLKRAVTNHWQQALASFEPELIFISAGFDAHRMDPLGGLSWDTVDYEWVTQWLVEQADLYSGGRIVSMLEGGYHLDALAQSVRAHLEVLSGGATVTSIDDN
jgi:acetoin utilization deacetylase AcuC-like enzyme